jgi:hypothetical protein
MSDHNQKMNLQATALTDSQKNEITALLHTRIKSLLGIDDTAFIVE